jgi:hypothetical protein
MKELPLAYERTSLLRMKALEMTSLYNKETSFGREETSFLRKETSLQVLSPAPFTYFHQH